MHSLNDRNRLSWLDHEHEEERDKIRRNNRQGQDRLCLDGDECRGEGQHGKNAKERGPHEDAPQIDDDNLTLGFDAPEHVQRKVEAFFRCGEGIDLFPIHDPAFFRS